MTTKQKPTMSKFVRYTKIALLLNFLFLFSSYAQRIGDAGMRFDNSKIDPAYPQMREWMKAGVQGGIPLLSKSKIKKTISATNSDGINKAIEEVSKNGGGQLRLRNGNYTINKTIFPKNNVRIVGQSRDGVVLTITMRGKDSEAIYFRGTKQGSLERLTIKGNQAGKPDPFKLELVKPNYDIKGVVFGSGAKNCWLDKVTILNTGGSPVNTWKTDHLTFRDMYVDGVWNKGGGGSGYFAIQSGYALVYNCTIKNLRHFAIQREGAYYNVVYKNNITQDVNFHNADAGNNLIEQNNITIQSGFDFQYHAVMGPWASFHRVSDRDNYIYKNTCIERNNNNRRSFSDKNIVYLGPRRKEERSRIPEFPFDKSKKTPKHGTFYPVIEKNTATAPPVVVSPTPTPPSNVNNNKLQKNGVFYIRNKSNGQNVIAPKWDDYNTRMFNARTFNDQKWEFKHIGNGIHTIKNLGTNRYLEIPHGKCDNGSNVATWTNANSDHQKWILNQKNGVIYLLPKHCPSKALDKRGGKDQNVHLWAFNQNNNNQKFELIPVSGQKKLDKLSTAGIQLYPNPAIDNLSLNFSKNHQPISYTITSVLGQTLLQGDFINDGSITKNINVNNLSSGIYFIRINTSSNQSSFVEKFMISKP